MSKNDNISTPNNTSRVYVLFYSFFLIPLMVTIFGVLFFFIFQFLTMEPHSPHDLLNNIKIGSASKRWQSAYHLSQILLDEELAPSDQLFESQLISAYKKSIHDDIKVRIYLALAMGATRNSIYGDILLEGLEDESLDSRLAAIKALGMVNYNKAIGPISNFLSKDKSDSERLTATISLGFIDHPECDRLLISMLSDSEPNIQWDAAIALAKRGNKAGKPVIVRLLDRKYYKSFVEVDPVEVDQAILIAVNVSSVFNDEEIIRNLKTLSSTDESNLKIRNAALESLNMINKKSL